MSIDIDKQALEARWVGDVKVLLDNLNELLGKVPEGIDVKVSASEVIAQLGAIGNIADAESVWKIDIRATKTKTLI